MSAAQLFVVDAQGMTERLEHTVDVLRCALWSGDLLTARYAAASITELSDQIETALLAAGRIRPADMARAGATGSRG